MKTQSSFRRHPGLHQAPLLLVALCLYTFAHGADVTLAGIMGPRALLVVDGGPPRMVAPGERTPEGVRLMAVEGNEAVVELDGRRERVRLGAAALRADSPRPTSGSVTLHADARGHFVSDAVVNGARLRFLVDTGATLVSLGVTDARRAGVDFRKGAAVSVQTAAGSVQAWRVALDTLQIGSLVLHNVDAVVFEQELPLALLGMSVLDRVEMRREGRTLTLQKRY